MLKAQGTTGERPALSTPGTAGQETDQAALALLPLHPAEVRLLLLIRGLGHGMLHHVTVADGVPVLVAWLEHKVKLV